MAVATETIQGVSPTLVLRTAARNETYAQLVWRRFRKSKAAIAGGLMVIALAVLALFADFFSPNPLNEVIMNNAFISPHTIHFFDAEGKFHFVCAAAGAANDKANAAAPMNCKARN